jgi:hypothetical protein
VTRAGTTGGTGLAFGPGVLPPVTHVQDQKTTVVSFITEPSAVAPLLPSWFRPAEQPVVTFTHQELLGVDYMRAGRGYNLVNVAVSAVFDGQDGQLARSFPVVIWESDTMPIIAGRELHGNPKIFGQVSGLDREGDTATFTCGEHGTRLLQCTLQGLTALPEASLARVNTAATDSTIFGWKHVPGPQGGSDADYPTLIHGTTSFTQGWTGSGVVELGSPSLDEAPYSAVVLDALRALPQVSGRPAFHGVGSAILYRDRTERLHPA